MPQQKAAPHASLRGQHHVEEVALLVRPHAGDGEIGLQRVGIDEVLRRLHDADVVLAQQAERAAQELRTRHEVRIENADEVRRLGQRRHLAEPVVDVAGLGMGIVGARQVAGPEPLRHLLEPGPPAVVQHPHAKARIVHGDGADDRALQDRLVLVIGADEHVDERRRLALGEPAEVALHLRRAVAEPRQDDETESRAEHRHRLDDREHDADDPLHRQPERRQRRQPAPAHVAPHQHDDDGHHGRPRTLVAGLEPGQNHQGQADHQQARGQDFEKQCRRRAHRSKVTRPVRPMSHCPALARPGMATVTR